MQNTHTLFAPLYAFTLSSILASSLLAQEKHDEKRNDGHDTAKLSPLISLAHPISNANISIIDDIFIANTQAYNLSEIFNKSAEIQVGGGAQIAQKLYIRGFEDRMFNVRLDGIAQNGNLFHHQGNLILDSFLIKNIEIQKGLGSVENGAGAIAGGINITTKNAFDMLQNANTYGAHLALGGQSNRGVDTSLAAYTLLRENLGLLAGYSFENIPYYNAGNAERVPSSESKTHNATFKLTYLPAHNHSINVNYHFNHIDSIAPYGANVILSPNPALFQNTLNAHNASVQYEYIQNEHFQLTWNNYFSHKSLSLSSTDTLTAISDEEGAMDLSLLNLGSDLGFRHYFGASHHYFKYGLNYQLMHTKAHNLTDHSLEHGNLGRELGSIYGGYIGASFNVLDSLSLDIGSRYDYFVYVDKFDSTHHTQGFSLYISLLYTPSNDLSFKFTHNYNTRGAMPLDASLLSNSHAYIAALKAEGMYNTEFNADYDNGFFSAHASLYYQHLKHFINSYTNDATEHNHSITDGHEHEDMYRQNMPRAVQILGYEANIGLDFSFFDVHIGIAQSLPKYANHLITDTFELGAISGRSYYTSIGMRPFNALPQLQILYIGRYVEGIDYQGYNMYYNAIESVNKKGYDIHNLYLTYDLKSFLSFRLAFLNITNRTYVNPYSPAKELFSRESGSALYEPGFNTKAQIVFFF